ncbi:MAG TPA: GNAT family N-acetyltransferase [Polyangiaceae bacterium]|nr:GNAT family N-acetyltransferase [Polyangiaceae bacterium]HMR80344.1 GNAT family N-acetyltransferase [Polyangiaceae bacterium]
MLSASCIVRVATPLDAAQFASIVARGFEETRAFPIPSSALSETVAETCAALERDSGLLAVRDGVACGCMRVSVPPGCARLDQASLDAPPAQQARSGVTVQFSRLAVIPEARGQGVATALLAALSSYAHAIGAEMICMSARSQQPDNRPFWARRGFVVTGYSERYGIPDMVTHMQRRLSYGAEPTEPK